MVFKYLGTAACEGWPAMFCTCDNCKRAIKAGGRNLRSRSQAIIDQKLLIDFPADTYMHVMYQGLDLCKVTDLLITHTHSDHYAPLELENRQRGFAYFEGENIPLTIHGTLPVKEGLERYKNEQQYRVRFSEMELYKTYEISDYNVIALRADHDLSSGCVIYIIKDKEKTILYGNDTGYFPEESWRYMEDNKVRFDFVSLDCTCILQNAYRGHMGLNAVYDVKNRMLEKGLADQKTVFCLNHFSHNGTLTYDELTEKVKDDFLVSYDGMVINI